MFRTSDGAIHEIQEPQDGCWVALTNPTATEIFEISEQFQIEVDDLRAPLDEEERSRIEVEDTYTLILVDVPMIEERNDKDWYGTIPLGIIVTDKMIFTICLEDTQVLTRFMEGRVRNFFTYMKTRFILQILYRNASMYLRYLRIIDKKSEQVEEKLHFSPRNQELIELLELEKSLVYFTTSLRSNEAVLEKLIKIESIKKYPEDTELLEDVIIENTQAIEMANIYSGILANMMDAFASVISNNLNDVMKIDRYEYPDDRVQRLWNESESLRYAVFQHTVGIPDRHTAFDRGKYRGGDLPVKKEIFLTFLAGGFIFPNSIMTEKEKK